MTADRISDACSLAKLLYDLVGLNPGQRPAGMPEGLEDILPIGDVQPLDVVINDLIDLLIEVVSLDLLSLELRDPDSSAADMLGRQLEQRFDAASRVAAQDQDDVIAVPSHIIVRIRSGPVTKNQCQPAHLVKILQLERIDVYPSLAIRVIDSAAD